MKDRVRLAWTILAAAFIIFAVVLVGTPLGVMRWIDQATVPLNMVLQGQEGATQVERPRNDPRLLLAQHAPLELSVGTTVVSGTDAQSVLSVLSPQDDLLATIQVYPGSDLGINAASSPRFQSSDSGHRLEVTLRYGRLRLAIPESFERAIDIRVHTSHGQILLWPKGNYSIDVNGEESQVTTREGKSTIIAPSGQLTLSQNQRGIVRASGDVEGPLPPHRDLVVNSSFNLPIEPYWTIRVDNPDETQSAGSVEWMDDPGKSSIRLYRNGIGHSDTGIEQNIDMSLVGLSSLNLHVSARIDSQSLGLCGTVGSECPLMIRIDYEDGNGSPVQWIQGFYSILEPAEPGSPNVCLTCPVPRQEHIQQNLGVEFFHDSANLMELLASNGMPPKKINKIAVYASGHSYDVTVLDVEVVAQE